MIPFPCPVSGKLSKCTDPDSDIILLSSTSYNHSNVHRIFWNNHKIQRKQFSCKMSLFFIKKEKPLYWIKVNLLTSQYKQKRQWLYENQNDLSILLFALSLFVWRFGCPVRHTLKWICVGWSACLVHSDIKNKHYQEH